MRACPNCGHQNEDTAVVCVQCNQVLPPPAPPTAPPGLRAPIQLEAAPAQDGARKGRQYLLGLGLGLIPLLFLILSIGFAVNTTNGEATAVLAYSGLALALAAIIAMIACLSIARVRFVGYGLLTIILVSLIVGCISCVVALNQAKL